MPRSPLAREADPLLEDLSWFSWKTRTPFLELQKGLSGGFFISFWTLARAERGTLANAEQRLCSLPHSRPPFRFCSSLWGRRAGSGLRAQQDVREIGHLGGGEARIHTETPTQGFLHSHRGVAQNSGLYTRSLDLVGQASPNGGPRSGSGPSDGPIRTHDQFKII
jgi:hypothetical protein